MNDSLLIKPENAAAVPSEAPATQPLHEPAVARALAEISADSQHCPETYLRDTVVPHGGE